MTIDEAIKRYVDNAEYERTHGNLQGYLEFKRLEKWLKELKQLKEQEPCKDAVSREDVIKAVDHHTFDTDDGLCLGEDISIILEELPPVTPTHGTCKDCKHCDPYEESPYFCKKQKTWINKDNFGCTDFEKRGNENGSRYKRKIGRGTI